VQPIAGPPQAQAAAGQSAQKKTIVPLLPQFTEPDGTYFGKKFKKMAKNCLFSTINPDH
jgi:hypothetical protein